MTTPEPWWKPEALARRRAALAARGRMLRAVRAFFDARAFTEVETPALQASPGMEAHLRAFRTELAKPFGQGARAVYLHTSPEFAMKKLLAGGLTHIFQIARVFRNEERSALHHPEFTMLEWYRVGESLDAIMDDCEELLRAAANAAGTRRLTWRGVESDPFRPWRRLSVAEAFREYAGLDVLALAGDVAAFRAAAEGLGLKTDPADDWDDVFFRVFLDRIEPRLGIPSPTILHGYPASLAVLAKLNEKDPRVAERFELYVAGVELANAFGELTDAAEQRRRVDADNAKRERLFGERYPVDEDFLAAVAAMPPASGIALGFDRLVMLATGAEKIEDVLWAPVGT
jgi:lysyl-tRNA synthetase class 2